MVKSFEICNERNVGNRSKTRGLSFFSSKNVSHFLPIAFHCEGDGIVIALIITESCDEGIFSFFPSCFFCTFTSDVGTSSNRQRVSIIFCFHLLSPLSKRTFQEVKKVVQVVHLSRNCESLGVRVLRDATVGAGKAHQAECQ